MKTEIMLPWPPSVNTYWRMWRSRMVISKAGREFRDAVAEQVAEQNAAKFEDRPVVVVIRAYRPDKRKRDLDNLLKAALDSLSHAGVFDDDSQIQDLRIYWGDHIGGYLKVEVTDDLVQPNFVAQRS